MARKAVSIVENDGKEEDLDPETRAKAEELVNLNEATGGDLYRSIDELQSTQGVMMQFTRVTPAATAGYAGEVSVSEFTLEHAKQQFGAGRYNVRFKGPKGYVPGGGTLLVAPDTKPAANGGTDVTSFIQLMEKERAAAKERNSALLIAAIPTLGTVLAAMLGNRGPDLTALVGALKPAPGPSLTDLVTALSSIKNLQGDTTDPVDRVLKVMEAVKGISGGEGGESNWTDVVKELISQGAPMLKPALENIAANQQAEAQRRQQLTIQPLPASSVVSPTNQLSVTVPIPSGAIVTSAEPTPASIAAVSGETDMLSLFMPTIREHLAKVTKWAEANKNPETYAEVFFDDLPTFVWQYVKPQEALSHMQREDWFQKLVEFYPALETHREWCEEFRNELISIIVDNLEESKNEKDGHDE